MTDMSTHPVAVEALPPKVAAAICGVMSEVPMLGKDAKNQHGNYNFASIDDFLEAVRPLCAKHGLIIMQDEESFEMKDGWLVMTFRFTLAHSSGETWGYRPTRTIMVSAKMGSQAFGAAQSYALKQFERSLFQIATGEKGNDADEHPAADLPSQNRQPAPKQAAPKAEPKVDKPDVSARATAAADKLIAGMTGSLGDASRLMSENGLIDINGDEWTLEPKSALSGLKSLAPTEYERIRAAYTALQNKDIAA